MRDQYILRFGKIPINYQTRQTHDVQDPNIWLPKSTALMMADDFGEGFGIGYVFVEGDGYFFLDIDHCLINGQWSDLAVGLLAKFPGAFVEVSQSGTGLHIIGRYQGVIEHSCRNQELGLELYTGGRYCALTGTHENGNTETDCTDALQSVVNEYFTPTVITSLSIDNWTTTPREDWSGPSDDEELIALARAQKIKASNVFGKKPTFDDLWTRNIPVLTIAYPDEKRPYDCSAADAALANHLAFWTGCDCERIERIMNLSGLKRNKWVDHKSYLYRTITMAVRGCKNVYNRPKTMQINKSTGLRILFQDEQIEHFKGCVYVCDIHRVFTMDGKLLKPEQFKVVYGSYIFSMTANNDKTTKDAWEAFTINQGVQYPQADSLTFRPDRPTGELFNKEGKVFVNSYVDIPIDRKQGDVSPFLNHLNKVLPVKSDADIFLAYMAAVVQHKGVKFQWCPLIQGVEGNGKTLFTRCVSHAVGERYTHYPKADEIGGKFNSWLQGKILIGVEDVWFPKDKTTVIENLKPLITNNKLPIEQKGVDQVTAHICANFMLNSNHKDSITKTKNDRRFCVFYSAQQQYEDLARDGMDGDYFPNLYKWLRLDGFKIVTEYLNTYEIPDHLNPAGSCNRAPITSTTGEVLQRTMGGFEQEIIEAIEQDRPGFAGGWVSSIALSRLAETLRYRVNTIKRFETITDLGFIKHPGLINGRVNHPIISEAGKPILYIKKGHAHQNAIGCANIVQIYLAAQEGKTNVN